jgi:transcriptional regulator with XRE-family HTH domain
MKGQDNISEIDQYIIDAVRHFRQSEKKTQEDIASILEVSREFVKDVESPNRPQKYNPTHINAIADHFSISPREFIPEKAFPVNSKEKTKPSALKKKTVSKSVPVKQVKKIK